MYWPLIEAHYYMIDLVRITPRKFANLVYAWLVLNLNQERVEAIESEMLEPLPWQDSNSQAAIDAESASFLQMQALGE